MTWWPSLSPITISIGIFLGLILVFNAGRMLLWLASQHDAFERHGTRLRAFKYQTLVPWVDRIPLSANVMTGLRLVFVGGSLVTFTHHLWTGYTVTLFVVGWLTDYLDGLKAHAEQERLRSRHGRNHYRAPVFGKYFDPTVDMLCFVAMAIVCWNYFPVLVMASFVGAIALRTLLFGLLLFQRRHRPTWRERLTSDILPKTISGEVKAGIIAASFGLVILGSTSAIMLTWAGRLLLVAVVIEILTLAYLVRTTIRMLRIGMVEPLKKTGSD